jgi:hypothetical protein
VTGYGWPPRTGGKVSHGAQRQAYNAGLSAGATPEALEQALRLARLHEADRGVRRDRRGRRIVSHAPPAADDELWQPLGPFVGLRGQADSDPRVAGRVRDIALSADGTRAYAATANGGVWYTGDSGGRWEPVGAFAMTRNRADVRPSSHTQVCGCLHVVFDAGDDLSRDEVWVGTGEPQAVFDPGTGGGRIGGVGILHARGPVTAVRADREVDPWTREAAGLAGAGVYRIAAAPGEPGRLVAATTRGLWERDPTLAPDPWRRIPVAAWVDASGADVSDRVRVTDVSWPRRDRVWIAVVTATPNLTGLWLADGDPSHAAPPAGLANAAAVNLAVAPTHAIVDGAGAPTVDRIALASAPALPDVVYAVASRDLLWRVDATTVRIVTPAPPRLFGAGLGQSGYDMAIAVSPEAGRQPDHPRRFHGPEPGRGLALGRALPAHRRGARRRRHVPHRPDRRAGRRADVDRCGGPRRRARGPLVRGRRRAAGLGRLRRRRVPLGDRRRPGLVRLPQHGPRGGRDRRHRQLTGDRRARPRRPAGQRRAAARRREPVAGRARG